MSFKTTPQLLAKVPLIYSGSGRPTAHAKLRFAFWADLEANAERFFAFGALPTGCSIHPHIAAQST